MYRGLVSYFTQINFWYINFYQLDKEFPQRVLNISTWIYGLNIEKSLTFSSRFVDTQIEMISIWCYLPRKNK